MNEVTDLPLGVLLQGKQERPSKLGKKRKKSLKSRKLRERGYKSKSK